MVKHYIIWKLKQDISDPAAVKQNIKSSLEDLVGKIPGLLEMTILFDPMDGSAGDVFMDSSFESAEDLAAYQKHPLHVEIANSIVCPAVDIRLSFDCERE